MRDERRREESDLLSRQIQSALALLQPEVDKEQCPPDRVQQSHKKNKRTYENHKEPLRTTENH